MFTRKASEAGPQSRQGTHRRARLMAVGALPVALTAVAIVLLLGEGGAATSKPNLPSASAESKTPMAGAPTAPPSTTAPTTGGVAASEPSPPLPSAASQSQAPSAPTDPASATTTTSVAAPSTSCASQTPGPAEINGVPSCLATTYPDNYAGVYATSESAVTILELNHDPALEAAATAGLAGYQVSFELVAHTYAQLQQVLSSIRATRNTLLHSQGIDIVSGGLNEKTNQVVVGITNPDGTAAGAYFGNQYGQGTVLVQPSASPSIAATGQS